MLFDTDIVNFEINVSFIEFCYACLPVLKSFKTLLLLPIFQRSFVVFVTRFLNGSAKVRGFAFQPTFSENIFQIFFQTLNEEVLIFYWRITLKTL
jgi:hypothetical protein